MVDKLPKDYTFDQLIINEYEPGQGIAMHTDAKCFADAIACVSTLSPCVMDFQKGTTKQSLILPPGCLLLMTGEARGQWKHGIAGVRAHRAFGGSMLVKRSLRLSFTFRMVLPDKIKPN